MFERLEQNTRGILFVVYKHACEEVKSKKTNYSTQFVRLLVHFIRPLWEKSSRTWYITFVPVGSGIHDAAVIKKISFTLTIMTSIGPQSLASPWLICISQNSKVQRHNNAIIGRTKQTKCRQDPKVPCDNFFYFKIIPRGGQWWALGRVNMLREPENQSQCSMRN